MFVFSLSLSFSDVSYCSGLQILIVFPFTYIVLTYMYFFSFYVLGLSHITCNSGKSSSFKGLFIF